MKATTQPGELTFAHLLRQYLEARNLNAPKVAELWHLDPDTINKILRGDVSVPRTKVGFWAQLLEMPEDEILAAVNRTRAHLGRVPLTPPPEDIGIPIHTVEQTKGVLEHLQAAHPPPTTRQHATADEAAGVTHGR